MFQKIILFIVCGLCLFGSSPYVQSFDWSDEQKRLGTETRIANEKAIVNAKAAENKAKVKAAQTKHDEECADSKSCIEKPSFTINVNDFSPGLKVSEGSSQENINSGLSKIIQTLMVWLWSLSLLIMTIGAGYMVAYHGQDELLSKGKSIFTSGIIALVVALSSYLLVELVVGILY